VGCGEDSSARPRSSPDVDHDGGPPSPLRPTGRKTLGSQAEWIDLHAIVFQNSQTSRMESSGDSPTECRAPSASFMACSTPCSRAGNSGLGEAKRLLLAQQFLQLGVPFQTSAIPRTRSCSSAGHLLLAEAHPPATDGPRPSGRGSFTPRPPPGWSVCRSSGQPCISMFLYARANPRPFGDLGLAQALLVAEATQVVGKGALSMNTNLSCA